MIKSLYFKSLYQGTLIKTIESPVLTIMKTLRNRKIVPMRRGHITFGFKVLYKNNIVLNDYIMPIWFLKMMDNQRV